MTKRILYSATAFALIMGSTGLADAAGQTEITDTFCTQIQTSIMDNTIPAENLVHPSYDAFVLSKASVDPLRNQQFTTPGPNGQPRMVSCKMKTPDHIREVYGEQASNEDAKSCEAMNREIVAAVIASLTPEEQNRRVLTDDQIIFVEDDSVMTGQSWTKPFDFVTRDENGAIRIKSKRMQVDWTNMLFKMAPERFRGALYCHLTAPEYVKAMLLGEDDVPAPAEES